MTLDITGSRRYTLRLMSREGGYLGHTMYWWGYVATDGSNSAFVSIRCHAYLVEHHLITKVEIGGHDIWHITQAGRDALAAVAEEAR